MNCENLFEGEYDPELLRLIQPAGWNFRMFVPPRYEAHYVDREYERLTARLIANMVRTSDIFVDVGAHSGFFSLLAVNSNPDVRVIALEPTPFTFDVLKRNAETNSSSSKFDVYQAAVSRLSGTKTFTISGASDSCSFYEHPNAASIDKLEVRTIALDELLREHFRSRVVIKIDTDGHELEVLAGMTETIKFCDDLRLIIEFNPKMQRKAGYQPSELLQDLDRRGFDLFVIDDDREQYFKVHPGDDSPHSVTENGYSNIYCIKKSRSLNVVFFAHSPLLAGAERSLLELINELIADYGVICTVVVPGAGPFASECKKIGASIVLVDGLVLWCEWQAGFERSSLEQRLIAGTKAFFLKIAPLLKAIEPDLIYTQTMTVPWGVIAASLVRKPHVWSICEYGELDHGLKFLESIDVMTEEIARGSSLLLTNSNDLAKTLFSDLPIEKVKTVYRHISIPLEFSNAELSRIDVSNPINLVLVGTITEGKGQLDAVRATKELVAQGYDVHLRLIGYAKPSYAHGITDLIESLNIKDRVQVEEFTPNPYAAIASSDILLVCSRHEAFGRVAVEGMLLGKPVVYPGSGGVAEYMKDGVTGLEFNVGDYTNLAMKIRELIDDPERARLMATNAREYANEKFSRDAYGGEIFRSMNKLKTNSGDFPVVHVPSQMLSAVFHALEQSEFENCAFAKEQRLFATEREKFEIERREKSALSEELAAIRSSTSWRLTKPIRLFRRLLNRAL